MSKTRIRNFLSDFRLGQTLVLLSQLRNSMNFRHFIITLCALCRKTLQTLALLWTVLKQGPLGRPLVKRAIIVTPATITQNWAAEASPLSPGDPRAKPWIIRTSNEASSANNNNSCLEPWQLQ